MSDNLSFDDAIKALDQIVNQLESGGLTLEESLALFERGQQMAVLCMQTLDQAELRLEELRGEE